MLRAQKLLETIKELKPGEFAFTAIDEMFSGTSGVEGAAAAYSIGKHLGTFDQSICMIATHYPLLTRLEADCDSFTNYKVSVDITRAGKLMYPFKLEKGISDQHIALDILRDQGFDSEIIETAQEIIDRVH